MNRSLIPVGDPILAERPSSARLFEIPGWANRSHQGRVQFIRDLVEDYSKDPELAKVAVGIFRERGVEPRNGPGQAAALLEWVQQNIYWTMERDERLQSPWRSMQWRFGDCDDQAILLCSLAQSVGLETRLVLAGHDPRARKLVRWIEGQGVPSQAVGWSHIYCQIGWPSGHPAHWLSAEPTMTDAHLGYDVAIDGVSGDSHGRVWVPRPEDVMIGRGGGGSKQHFAGPSYGVPAREAEVNYRAAHDAPVFSVEFWQDALREAARSLPAALVGAAAFWLINEYFVKGKKR